MTATLDATADSAAGPADESPVSNDLRPALDAELVRKLVAAVHVTSAHTFSVWSPINGDQIAEIPEGNSEDVANAYQFARRAQRSWAQTTVKHRAGIVLKFHDLILQHRDEGLDIVQWETGKARKDALEELLDVCLTARHYARVAAKLLHPKGVRGALPLLVGAKEFRHPKGVVGIIAPWNYPLTLAVSDAIPALLAGNAVVLKPDTQTTLISLWVVDLLRQAGLPDDLMQVVPGDGAALGSAMIADANYVMFTGSTRVGRLIASQAGERLIGCSLELGGKNAMIVCADANVEKAAEVAVRACFANSGQLCISMERMYIEQAIWDEFVPAFVARVKAMRQKVGVGWGADIGSMISARQLEAVEKHVDDAVAHGATVLAGGKARPDIGPFAFEPTVLTDVTEEMQLCRNETFGPVVSLYPVADVDEAITASNDSDFGLNASVLTGNSRRGISIGQQLHAGTVNVNEGYAAAWGSTGAPMGGMGDSGLGRRHGDEGLLKYTEPQTVAVQRALGFGPQFGMSDKKWGDTLTLGIKALRRAGLK